MQVGWGEGFGPNMRKFFKKHFFYLQGESTNSLNINIEYGNKYKVQHSQLLSNKIILVCELDFHGEISGTFQTVANTLRTH